jgi:hypothetical protein
MGWPAVRPFSRDEQFVPLLQFSLKQLWKLWNNSRVKAWNYFWSKSFEILYQGFRGTFRICNNKLNSAQPGLTGFSSVGESSAVDVGHYAEVHRPPRWWVTGSSTSTPIKGWLCDAIHRKPRIPCCSSRIWIVGTLPSRSIQGQVYAVSVRVTWTINLQQLRQVLQRPLCS